MASIRVLIADDHAVVRQGLRTFLELQDDIEVVADACDGGEAVSAALESRPDVVLMDLVMPDVDGIEATRRILRERPATRVIALTSFLDDDQVLPAVRAGAAGYLLKDVEPEELVRAIHTVHAGEALLHPAVTARVIRELTEDEPGSEPSDAGLTAREREVLALVAQRPAEQADRARARDRREDGQGPREQHPGEARRERPDAGGAGRGAAGVGGGLAMPPRPLPSISQTAG